MLALPLTDIGYASRFVLEAGDRAKWSEELNHWVVWDDRRWASRGRGADLLAMEVAQVFGQKVLNAPPTHPDRATLIAAISDLQNVRRLRPMLDLARASLEIDVEELDRHKWLFNTLDGTLDLQLDTTKVSPQVTFREHCQSDMLTHLVPIVYNPAATCPMWREFLDFIAGDTAGMSRYLQQLVGIFLTGDVSEKMFIIICGDKDAGKTAFTNTVFRLLGEFAQVMSQATLAKHSREAAGNAASPDIARLKGKRLAVVSETTVGLELNEARLKAQTGRTRLTGRHLFGPPFDFDVTHKLMVETNHRPSIPGGDEAVWRRVHLIVFTHVVPLEDQDPDFEDRLTDELPGILNWAIEGCIDWQVNGLQVPEEVLTATKRYQEEENPLYGFIEDYCELKPDGVVPKKDLWFTYTSWAQESGIKPRAKPEFNRALGDLGITAHKDSKDSGAWKWHGIELLKSFGGLF
jgi:putative DNA primase/helicase